MVAVVQLVEHQVVILGVAGSSPVSHPEVEHRLTHIAGEAMFVFQVFLTRLAQWCAWMMRSSCERPVSKETGSASARRAEVSPS